MSPDLETGFDWSEWDAFIADALGASFYHCATWLRGLAEIYGYRPACLVLRDSGHLRAALPFVETGRAGLLHRISLPFGTYGGPICAPDLNWQNAGARLRREFLNGLGGRVQRITLIEGPDCVSHDTLPRGTRETALRTQVLDLRDGWEQVLAGSIRKEKRRQMRKAARAGVKVERSGDPADIAAYFKIYQEHVRDWNLATPTPLAHLRQLVQDEERVRFWIARLDGEIIGGHFNLHFGRTVTAWNGTASKAHRTFAPSIALYAANLERACADGDEFFNFGGSGANDPLFDFKASFGAEPQAYRSLRRQSRLLDALEHLRGRGGAN